MAVFMLETSKLSETLKLSRDDFNVLDNFNLSSIKTANVVRDASDELLENRNSKKKKVCNE